MKAITRFLMAVVALVALSCTTDATQDLGVDLGNNEALTEITLSLEESRTQLGEKAGEVYPLYWSEGDQIAINGVASAPLTAEYDGKSAAVFSLDGDIERPFHIVYPAPAEGVVAATSGLYPVTFPATQSYTAGTFESGTAPMYGYAAAAAEGEEVLPAVEIHHLTGILRLAVKGDKTLTSMTVVAETGAIAGNFDVNCESGALTAHEDASNTITMSFGEGLTLSDTATPIYVAVPAGEHGIYTITLFTDEAENNAMVVRFNSDNHPVKAGVVKEFGEVIFVPNATASPVSGELVIENEADLVRLAKMSEVGLLGSVTSVRVAASLDMSNVEDWHGIDRFPAIPFDGGSDKGFEIKGLKAPLFLATEAQIKNVKLTDVNMNSSDRKRFGAIVCELNCTKAETVAMQNCSVAGTIIIENPNTIVPEANKNNYGYVTAGSLIGVLTGGEVIDCVNNASFTVKQVASLGNTIALYPSFGGVIGCALSNTLDDATETTAATVITTKLTNLENRGEVKYEDNAKSFIYRPVVAGILGYTSTTAATVMTNCDNFANVSFNAIGTGAAGANTPVSVAGVAGVFCTGTIDGCDNSGDITMDGRTYMLGIGGLFGYCFNSVTTNCHNTGKVEVKSTMRTLGLMAGGFAATIYNPNDGAVGSCHDCSNNGPVNVLCSTDEENIKNGSYYYRVGGFTAFGRQLTKNCHNLQNGDITLSGKWIHMSSTERSINIAGVIGYKTKGAIANCDNYGDINIDTDITINSTSSDVINAQILNIGGVVSDSSYSTTESDNHGNITFSGSFAGYRATVGGILGNGISNNVRPGTGAVNNGNITFTEDAQLTLSADIFLGGCVGITEATAVDGMTNNGDIVFKGDVLQWTTTSTNAETGEVTESKSGGNFRAGGVSGYITAAHSNLVNNGKFEVTSDCLIEGSPQIGGVVGDIYNKATDTVYDTYTNNGEIIYNAHNKGALHLGGITSDPYCATMQNMTNNGAISLNGIYDGAVKVAGCFGFHDKELLTLKNCTNNAPITVLGESNSTTALYVAGVSLSVNGKGPHNNIYNTEKGDILLNLTHKNSNVTVAGITNKFQDKSYDVVNHGDITVKGDYGASVYITGFCYATNNYVRERHGNTGDFLIDAKIGGTLIVGGMYCYGKYGGTFTDCFNTGNYTVSENTEVGNGTYIGGMIGYFNATYATYAYKNCYNSGNISFKGKAGVSTEAVADTNYNKENTICLGGFAGQVRNDGTKNLNITDGFRNSGKIEFTGSNPTGPVFIGGIVGDMARPTSSWTGDIVNTGDIIFTGSSKSDSYAGGIFGRTIVGVANATSHCKVDAQGVAGSGHITGSSRSETVIATNCKVGGIATAYDTEDESYEEENITASNFHKYIYGGTTDWSGVVEYDGCTFLAEKPTFE